jgi:hypothetical protein
MSLITDAIVAGAMFFLCAAAYQVVKHLERIADALTKAQETPHGPHP